MGSERAGAESPSPAATGKGNVSVGPKVAAKPCQHDSMRADGLLDAHCLRCGANGYWQEGHRHDHAHPSGKMLFSLADPLVPVEGYPAGWLHCTIHLDPETGAMHSDGDHRVRRWIEQRLASLAVAEGGSPSPSVSPPSETEVAAGTRALEEFGLRGLPATREAAVYAVLLAAAAARGEGV